MKKEIKYSSRDSEKKECLNTIKIYSDLLNCFEDVHEKFIELEEFANTLEYFENALKDVKEIKVMYEQYKGDYNGYCDMFKKLTEKKEKLFRNYK